jgi:hypothetical protein
MRNDESTIGKERLWLALVTDVSTRDAPIKSELFDRYGDNSLILQKEFVFVTVYLFDISS